MTLLRHLVLSAALGSSWLSANAQQPVAPQSADDLPEVPGLADPFVFTDGSRVRSKADWARRREELKKLFADYEYGSLPAKPEKLSIFHGDRVMNEKLGIITQDFVLHLAQGYGHLDVHLRVNLPLGSPGKVPVVIQAGDGGGATVPPFPGFSAPAEETGPSVFTAHGYATATFRFADFASDNKDTARKSGIYLLFGDAIDTGGLMAWAWGIHRVIDALATMERIDAGKIVVTGHSRNGKAALLAGAFDERIALTVPQHSGCGGAAPYRFIYGNNEQLHNIAGFAPQWFRPGFNQFVGKVTRLPVDQHWLKALVAPRALMTTEGTNDNWTNPQGSQLTYLAAKEVYAFLGAADKISTRYRPVGHIPSNEDLVEYADHVFFGKPLPVEFGQLAYEVETKAYSWEAPE